jgi:hypothetical protein
MSYRTINLSLKCVPFMTSNYRESLTAFLLHNNNTTYLISLHHHLPIDTVYEKQTESACNILVNSCWSEALIMDSHNIDISQFTVFKKIQNSIKSFTDSEIFILLDKERNRIDITRTIYEPFDYLNFSPETPYLIGKLKIPRDSLAGKSGSPVFIREGNEDILIGVLSKHDTSTQCVHIIPIYVYIKALEKKDNVTIYGVDCTNASKIGSYNITEDLELGKTIYHPTLKVSIPLKTYFLLEGDENATFAINNNLCRNGKIVNIINNVNTISINHNLIVSHEESLLFSEQGRFKINLRLLSLFKRICVPEMQKKIFTKIQTNLTTTKSNDFWMDLKPK